MTTLRFALAGLMLPALVLPAVPAIAGPFSFELPRLDFGTTAAASTSGQALPACFTAPCPAAK